MALEVVDLVVEVDGGKRVLDGVSLRLGGGELVVVMGPNGSGKTSLAYTIMGHPDYRVVGGRVLLDGEDITDLSPGERGLRGLFLLFQDPVEIPGVTLHSLLTAALNKRMGTGDLTSPVPGLRDKLAALAEIMGLSREHVDRDLYVSWSGGEKKRGELLQARMLRPRYVLMDEPDSGLDVDGVRMVADTIKEFLGSGTGVLLITHYPRVLEYVAPSRVIVLYRGRVVARDGMELVEKINREGYRWLGERDERAG